MISLALPIAKSCSSVEASDTSAPAADGKGLKSAFSDVLASLSSQQTDADGDLTASAEEPAPLPATGTALPVPARTGKILPDIAAVLADLPADGLADLPAETSDHADDREGTAEEVPDAHGEDLTPLLPLSIVSPAAQASLTAKHTTAEHGAHPMPATPGQSDLPLPALAAKAKHESGEAPSRSPAADHAQTGAKPTHASPGQAASAAAELSLPAAALLAPARRESGERAEARSVAIHVAPGPAAHSSSSQLRTEVITDMQPAKVRDTAVEGLPATRGAAVDLTPQSAPGTPAQALPTESSPSGRPVEIARPVLHSDALQDLTRIVERLAAARDAFTPAATALAVRHDEFGELSLSFDQQRDGQLAVRLSAADPDAHRAIAAAVGERSAAAPTTSDSHASSGQSQSQPRGAAAERDGNGGNSAQRHSERQDQAQQRRSAANSSRQGSGNAPRAGIFA
jgi:hypothetical protein